MNPISFMTANYVARQLNYHMTEGWGQGDAVTQDAFRPFETFPARFRELLQDIRALGFGALDLWAAHLYPAWATPDHLAAARDLLAEFDLHITSYALWLGDLDTLDRAIPVMQALDIPLIGGGGALLETHRDALIDRLRDAGLAFGYENHAEKTPEELLVRIGERDPQTIGIALDTGWFGVQGYPADRAAALLADRIKLVHLKDVRTTGVHDTCALGDGIVPVRGCVDVLRAAGYTGAYSIEHEPETYDPTDEIAISAARLRAWLEA